MKETTYSVRPASWGLLLLLPFAGCGPDDSIVEPEDQNPALTAPVPVAPPLPDTSLSDLSGEAVRTPLVGEITRVDPVAGTFSVNLGDGTSRDFRFSDATSVTGDGAAQGLAGSEGARVVVYYEGEPGAERAIRIEILRNADTESPEPILP